MHPCAPGYGTDSGEARYSMVTCQMRKLTRPRNASLLQCSQGGPGHGWSVEAAVLARTLTVYIALVAHREFWSSVAAAIRCSFNIFHRAIISSI